jgi:glutamyl-Q tRNA(Asp) synthetase
VKSSLTTYRHGFIHSLLSNQPYTGRFAPSPSGPLHAGSLVAALASYLDAKAHNGQWLVRIEDIDEGRTVPDAATHILNTLTMLGMQWDGDVIIQSQRKPIYQTAYDKLSGLTYPCACTRREIVDSRVGTAADGSAIYPGTCRNGIATGKVIRSLRIRVPEHNADNAHIAFHDRWLGQQDQHLARDVGDFILKRADGYWAYQIAVVVDDALQGITHIVRGADLLDSTARQIYLQRCLGYATPTYLHVPLLTTTTGEKLSKQNHAAPLDLTRPLDELKQAAQFLGLSANDASEIPAFLLDATEQWAKRFKS